MNWTGGRRARASKTTADTARLQKQYFAKIRSEINAATFVGGHSLSPGNDDDDLSSGHLLSSAARRRRKRRLPELDIIVGKRQRLDTELDAGLPKNQVRQPNSPKDTTPLFNEGEVSPWKDSSERQSSPPAAAPISRADGMKALKQKLLETDDWVCADISRPLELKLSRPPTRRVPVRRSNSRALTQIHDSRKEKEKAQTLTQNSSKQYSPTELSSVYPDYGETGFNAFKPLSQGGYVRIGKRKAEPKKTTPVRSNTPFEQSEVTKLTTGADKSRMMARDDHSQDSMLLDSEDRIEEGSHDSMPFSWLPSENQDEAHVSDEAHSDDDDLYLPAVPRPKPVAQNENFKNNENKIMDNPDEDDHIEKLMIEEGNMQSTPPAVQLGQTKSIFEMLEEEDASICGSSPSLEYSISPFRSSIRTVSSPTSRKSTYLSQNFSTAVEQEVNHTHNEDDKLSSPQRDRDYYDEEWLGFSPSNPSLHAFASSSRGVFSNSDKPNENDDDMNELAPYLEGKSAADLDAKWQQYLNFSESEDETGNTNTAEVSPKQGPTDVEGNITSRTQLPTTIIAHSNTGSVDDNLQKSPESEGTTHLPFNDINGSSPTALKSTLVESSETGTFGGKPSGNKVKAHKTANRYESLETASTFCVPDSSAKSDSINLSSSFQISPMPTESSKGGKDNSTISVTSLDSASRRDGPLELSFGQEEERSWKAFVFAFGLKEDEEDSDDDYVSYKPRQHSHPSDSELSPPPSVAARRPESPTLPSVSDSDGVASIRAVDGSMPTTSPSLNAPESAAKTTKALSMVANVSSDSIPSSPVKRFVFRKPKRFVGDKRLTEVGRDDITERTVDVDDDDIED